MTDTQTYRQIPLAAIEQPRLMSRFRVEDEGIKDLAASIQEVGLLEPIVVVTEDDESYTLVAGQRRIRAVHMLGWEEIPAHVLQGDDRYQGAATISENLHRQDLEPLEEAVTLHEYIEINELTQSEAARRLGVSRSWVTHRLQLLDLPEDLHDAITLQDLPPTTALELARVDDDEDRRYYTSLVLENGATLHVVREWVRNYLRYQHPEPETEQAPPVMEGDSLVEAPPAPSCHVCGGSPPQKPLRMMYLCWTCAAALDQAAKEER